MSQITAPQVACNVADKEKRPPCSLQTAHVKFHQPLGARNLCLLLYTPLSSSVLDAMHIEHRLQSAKAVLLSEDSWDPGSGVAREVSELGKQKHGHGSLRCKHAFLTMGQLHDRGIFSHGPGSTSMAAPSANHEVGPPVTS